jgi:hypothetical protein
MNDQERKRAMKAEIGIISLIFCVSICIAALTDAVAGELPDLTFGKYYESYEPNIEPNAPGYTLPLDLDEIVNFSLLSDYNMDSISELIRQNGFAVWQGRIPGWDSMGEGDDIVACYRELLGSYIPVFITTDTLLHLYHLQFDETLRDIEEREFIPDINDLSAALLSDALEDYEQLEGDLKQAAERNVAYLSVAQKLVDPNSFVSEMVYDTVAAELGKIEAHTGFAPSEIFIYEEDYSQYVPQGHYRRSEQLKRYFKTMMWYGRMAFLLKGSENWGQAEEAEALVSEYDAKIQTLQAFLLANSLKNIQVGVRSGLDIWDRLYTVTAFYVGTADDLTPYDYLWALDQVFEAGFVLSDLANENNQLALKMELALLPSPKIYGGTGNIIEYLPVTDESLNRVLDKTRGMRMMGQRFVPDSYMFQRLVFPEVDSYLGDLTSLPFTAGADGNGWFCRAYVRGLDIMAVLGSHEALKILLDEGDTNYLQFWQRFGELKDEFDVLGAAEWNRNLYWSWLYTLKALLDELPKGYPNFMRTQAWQRRQLHSALCSWTQLRHDTILYAKQSYTSARGGGLITPPPGYIEPVPVFWGRLLAMTQMTSQGLDDLNVLTPEARDRFEELEKLLQRVLDIVSKQLTNMDLSAEDRTYILVLPDTLDSIVTGMEDIGLKTTLAADVHTDAHEEKVVEEATGKIDLIVVACPTPDGRIFLALGPVLSYYEFKQPMSNRLTDEKWRELLDSPDKPDRPEWYVPMTKQHISQTMPTRPRYSGGAY